MLKHMALPGAILLLGLVAPGSTIAEHPGKSLRRAVVHRHRHARHYWHHGRCRPCDIGWGRVHGWHPEPTWHAEEVASGGWVIPEAIVMCESSGQNLSPNGASAAGYYQITS